jgi:hypothetical protein
VRLHELVRGEDASAREERREENEVENEEGREAEAAGCNRFLATITRKYDSTQPRSRR